MPCILLHQTWQIYPPWIKHTCLAYCYTKLGRSTSRSHIWQICLADLPPSIEHRCLTYCYTTHGRFTPHQLSIDAFHTVTPHMADLPPKSSIDALHTVTPNMADLLADLPPGQSRIDALHTTTPNLADLPPINQAYMPCILLHQTWQIY